MGFAPFYLIYRLFYRIWDFFRRWYFEGSRYFGHSYLSTLESLDETFAVKITLRHFFEPLYGDYSFVGRILGMVFRTLRTALGLCFYLVISLCYAFVYGAWLLFPLFILANALLHLER